MVEGFGRDDRSDGVVECQRGATESLADALRQPIRGEGTRRHDAGRGKVRDFLTADRHPRMRGHPIVHFLRELVAIDREGRPGRHPGQVGALQQQAAQVAQLGLEQTVRVGEPRPI